MVCPRVSNSLALYKIVRPTAREERVFADAVAFARTLGLRVPPGVCEVYWVISEPHEYPGMTYHRERPVRVYLKRGLSSDALLETVFHELQHVSDAQYPDMERWQREDRAERFADRAMGEWRKRRAGARDGLCPITHIRR